MVATPHWFGAPEKMIPYAIPSGLSGAPSSRSRQAIAASAMTDRYYPVLEVPSSAIDPEDEPERLGSKRKFWFRRADGVRCLFKFPRRDFGEHWAEKVAAEVGSLIGVRCAEVQLARFGDAMGSQSPAFAEPEWLRVHGNEVMTEVIPGYDGTRDTGRGDHNIRNILVAVGTWAERNGLDPQAVLGELASYAILDGLIGTTRTGCSSTIRDGESTNWRHPTTTAQHWGGSCMT